MLRATSRVRRVAVRFALQEWHGECAVLSVVPAPPPLRKIDATSHKPNFAGALGFPACASQKVCIPEGLCVRTECACAHVRAECACSDTAGVGDTMCALLRGSVLSHAPVAEHTRRMHALQGIVARGEHTVRVRCHASGLLPQRRISIS